MKRLLILFTLIVFASVSCAPILPDIREKEDKTGRWKKRDFSRKQFEKDLEGCERVSRGEPENPNIIGECLAKKRYKLVSGIWRHPEHTSQFQEDLKYCKEEVMGKKPEKPMTVDECLAQKGYKFEPLSPVSKVLLGVALVPVAVVLLSLGCLSALAYL